MSAVLPSVRDVLALDPVRYGSPRAVAAAESLDRPVRWVHVAEVPDIATLLRGGELVLTTGIGLPTDDDGLRAFIAALADVGIAGLVVELGRRYPTSVPRVMIAAAAKHGLPLIELRKPTPFVRITEAVHALIVDSQLAELRATEEIHQRFTELSVEGAEAAEVVAQAAALSGAPVVLENLSRQVLAYDAAGDRAELLLDGWEAQSRRIGTNGRTSYDADAGWLVTMVGARGQDWGRLLLRWPPGGAPTTGPLTAGSLTAGSLATGPLTTGPLTTGPLTEGAPAPGAATARAMTVGAPAGSPGEDRIDPPDMPPEPPMRLTILLERAASTLALGRLIRRDAEGLERQIHRTLLTALLDHTSPIDEVALRARALGVPLERRHLVGVVVRYRQDEDVPVEAAPTAGTGAETLQARLRDLAETVSDALRNAGVAGLASPIDDHSVGALIALRRPEDEDAALLALATALRRPRPAPDPAPAQTAGWIIAAGSGVSSLRDARRSLIEARQVAYAARHDRRDVPVFRLPHVGLAGLLHLLRDEPRVQTFVERELGPLLAYEAKHPKEQMLRTLRVYLDSGRNKSAAAGAAHLSRPAFYERLARIGRILDADLDAVEPCLSLHVALLALDAIRDV